jgi:glutamyl-tRNA synthetase
LTVRTRFAPSPTGYLHIGGARTALFNWLFARRHKGRFILRIEDTDLARSTAESVDAILDGLSWLGLGWDEGPFYQSRMLDSYRAHAEALIEKGAAYRCYCAPEELEERRAAALKDGRPPMYDRRCARRTDAPGKPFALRFMVPPGATSFEDMVKGPVAFENSAIEDLVLLRSDGTPTYNFCVVVDDATMGITHVIRGDDHINNTPKQILLYKALGYPLPAFAHLPMILGPDRTRLSKRHGATSVTAYRDMGILPHALVNYLARLGWSHGDQEIFSMDELVSLFSLESVGRSSGVFNLEKLLWLNQHYIKETDPKTLAGLVAPFLASLGVKAGGDERLPLAAGTLRERAGTLKEMAEGALFYFKDRVDYEPKAAEKHLTPGNAEVFTLLMERLSGLDDFNARAIEAAFSALMAEKGIKLGRLAQPVRVALTGTAVSPGIFETVEAMGKALTLKRLGDAVEYMKGARP